LFNERKCFNTTQIEHLTLNKFIIPAALVAIITVTGVFAFMSVEKASTVHGTLETNINTNTDAELDALDRGITFEINSTGVALTKGFTYVLIPAKAGKTLAGHALLTSIGNQQVAASQAVGAHECGLVTTAVGSPLSTGSLTGSTSGTHPFGNATRGNSTFGVLSSSILGAAEGIGVQVEGTGQTIGGVCRVTIFLDSNSGE